MKKILIAAMVMWASVAFGEDDWLNKPIDVEIRGTVLPGDTLASFQYWAKDTDTLPREIMRFGADGTITIKGKPVEQLSHPEIKAALAELIKSINAEDRIRQCERQKDYLLENLQKRFSRREAP